MRNELLSTVSFDKVGDLFKKQSETASVLDYPVGEGCVEVYTLAKGLQARFWNCDLSHKVELFGDDNRSGEPAYFTLAFFLSTKGFRFENRTACLAENISWDTIFISDKSACKLVISPGMKVQCLSISFSNQWFRNNVLEKSAGFEKIRDTVCNSGAFSLIGSMTSTEKKLVTDLVTVSSKGVLGSFSVTCGVFKMVSDFFLKLKERDSLTVNSNCVESSLAKIEAYIGSHLLGKLPRMKELEAQFAISASTLKRHFKRKFGMNISTYFIRKKLDYARQLIEEQHTNIREAAAMVGYRNVQHFIKIYQQYRSTILQDDLCDLNALLGK